MKFLMTYAQPAGTPPPSPETMKKIGEYSMKQMQAGVLLMTGGLVRPSSGIQVRREGGEFSATDGPFAETKELIDGFALLELPSREAAIAAAREFMDICGDGSGEILQVYDPQDIPQPSCRT